MTSKTAAAPPSTGHGSRTGVNGHAGGAARGDGGKPVGEAVAGEARLPGRCISRAGPFFPRIRADVLAILAAVPPPPPGQLGMRRAAAALTLRASSRKGSNIASMRRRVSAGARAGLPASNGGAGSYSATSCTALA